MLYQTLYIPKVDTSKGRFPANVILDEEAGRMLDLQSGESKSTIDNSKHKDKESKSWFTENQIERIQRGDSGGASRFFYCAKASKKERNAGCEDKEATLFSKAEKGLEDKKPVGSGFRLTVNPKATHGKSRAEMHGKIQNHHPTVKPLALMEYLCTLTKTPTGGSVLDPFMGSGTTGVACRNTGREFIGIEKEAEYCRIARNRIRAVETGVPVKEAGKGQMALFKNQ